MKKSSAVIATISIFIFIIQIVLYTSSVWTIGFPNGLSYTLASIASLLLLAQVFIWFTIGYIEGFIE